MDRASPNEEASSKPFGATVDLPPDWQKTFWGGPMPDFVSMIRAQRDWTEDLPGQEVDGADRT